MDNEINYQIIEDGCNSSYITSLITSLFYKSSNADDILNIEPVDPKFTYALELIRSRFVEPMRRGFSVHSDVINEFRNYINKCNWKSDVKTILNDHDIKEFYKYFMNKIYEDNDITFLRINNGENIGEVSMSIIELPVPIGLPKVSLTDLFKMWLSSNIVMDKYKYRVKDLPQIIPLFIKRDNSSKTKVDIMHKIKLFNVCDDLQAKISWNIHAIVCHNDDVGYYSIVKDGNKWINISDKDIPSFRQIDMYDETDVHKISLDSVLVFYKLVYYKFSTKLN